MREGCLGEGFDGGGSGLRPRAAGHGKLLSGSFRLVADLQRRQPDAGSRPRAGGQLTAQLSRA